MDWQASISHLKCHHSGHQAACITHHGGSSLWTCMAPCCTQGETCNCILCILCLV